MPGDRRATEIRYEPDPRRIRRTPVSPRALGLRTIVLPVALLAGALAAGRPGTRSRRLAQPRRLLPSLSAPACRGDPGPRPEARAPWRVTGGRDGAPAQRRVAAVAGPAAVVANLGPAGHPVSRAPSRACRVRRPGRDRAARQGPATDPAVVAIAGYLSAWTDPAPCRNPIAGLVGDGCPQTAILAEVPGRTRAAGLLGHRPHLYALVPPGVRSRTAAVGAGTPHARPAGRSWPSATSLAARRGRGVDLATARIPSRSSRSPGPAVTGLRWDGRSPRAWRSPRRAAVADDLDGTTIAGPRTRHDASLVGARAAGVAGGARPGGGRAIEDERARAAPSGTCAVSGRPAAQPGLRSGAAGHALGRGRTRVGEGPGQGRELVTPATAVVASR